jgi:flagellar basal body-associated protein FliL
MLILYRVLLVIALALALVLAAGTGYAFIFRPGPPEASGREALSPDSPPGLSNKAVDDRLFTGIGRIRALTAEPEAATVIISVIFPYASGDKVFSEELASRIGDFRLAIKDYFSSVSETELRGRDDETVKAELLRRFNSLLRLGRIEILYFDDYLIIE